MTIKSATIIGLLLAATCLGAGLGLARRVNRIDREYMQEEGLRNQADYLLGKGGYYRVERLGDGQLRVVCTNGGDATIRPEPDQFGSIVVDCGTR
jgi:hypothetical protein